MTSDRLAQESPVLGTPPYRNSYKDLSREVGILPSFLRIEKPMFWGHPRIRSFYKKVSREGTILRSTVSVAQ